MTRRRAHLRVIEPRDVIEAINRAGQNWLEREYPGANLVRVRCKRNDLLHAGDKWRARAIEVLYGSER